MCTGSIYLWDWGWHQLALSLGDRVNSAILAGPVLLPGLSTRLPISAGQMFVGLMNVGKVGGVPGSPGWGRSREGGTRPPWPPCSACRWQPGQGRGVR